MNTLLVTAYTPGYADLADRLVASADALGLRMCVVRYESTGDWVRNGHIKPRALMQVMLANPGRPVAWIDADAVIRRVPELFDQYPGAVAFHTVPKTTEVLSGTVWTRSLTFLQAWNAELERNPCTWDQRVLMEALTSSGMAGQYHQLPAEYCWVDYFAEPRWGGPRDPVIEHTQASRDVRAGRRAM